jgi:hypothetical protein
VYIMGKILIIIICLRSNIDLQWVFKSFLTRLQCSSSFCFQPTWNFHREPHFITKRWLDHGKLHRTLLVCQNMLSSCTVNHSISWEMGADERIYKKNNSCQNQVDIDQSFILKSWEIFKLLSSHANQSQLLIMINFIQN